MAEGLVWPAVPLLHRLCNPKALRNAGAMRALSRALNVDDDTILIFDSYLRAYESIFSDVRKQGGKVVVFPQNIDSLVNGMSDPMSWRHAPAWFTNEISAIGKADLVCCISREEQWLLSLFGIDSLYLPYYPPAEVLDYLMALRTRREQASCLDCVLILGTAMNAPTLQGMQFLLERAPDLVRAAGGREVLLAGYGTEVLRNVNLPRGFRVLGALSHEQMDSCLVRAAVGLCFQPGTTGALTRIAELLCVGVPVIANFVAARSYHNLPGMHVVETIDHLIEKLTLMADERVDVPRRPVELERQVIQAIKEL